MKELDFGTNVILAIVMLTFVGIFVFCGSVIFAVALGYLPNEVVPTSKKAIDGILKMFDDLAANVVSIVTSLWFFVPVGVLTYAFGIGMMQAYGQKRGWPSTAKNEDNQPISELAAITWPVALPVFLFTRYPIWWLILFVCRFATLGYVLFGNGTEKAEKSKKVEKQKHYAPEEKQNDMRPETMSVPNEDEISCKTCHYSRQDETGGSHPMCTFDHPIAIPAPDVYAKMCKHYAPKEKTAKTTASPKNDEKDQGMGPAEDVYPPKAWAYLAKQMLEEEKEIKLWFDKALERDRKQREEEIKDMKVQNALLQAKLTEKGRKEPCRCRTRCCKQS